LNVFTFNEKVEALENRLLTSCDHDTLQSNERIVDMLGLARRPLV